MIRAALLALALLAGAPPAAGAAAKTVEGPVAVMPLKNLNADPALDWLASGAAETMISDLQKTGSLAVVERAQIDRALGELLLDGKDLGDDAAATKVGKLVGAKTVVLGSYQKAGKQLRINVRFVTVETGVVLDTAKLTGPLESVFILQDQIVDRLLGKAPRARPKRKATPKAVESYRLYAMSLDTASDAGKVGYLRKSLALDPDFVYAKDDLAALENRLAAYRGVREGQTEAAEGEFWKKMADPALDPYLRSVAANQFLIRLQNERRWRQSVADAERLIALRVPSPPPGVVGAEEGAVVAIHTAFVHLRREDLALQAAERYLRDYPQGTWYGHLEASVKNTLERRRAREKAQPLIDARFAELDAELLKLEKEDSGSPGKDARVRNVHLERCWFPRNNDDYTRAIPGCEAFVKQYASDPDPFAKQAVTQARYYLTQAHAELGHFEVAVPMSKALVVEAADGPLASSVRSMIDNWPVDAAPKESP